MDFSDVVNGIKEGTGYWELKLKGLTEEVISERRNGQNRSIRQILGHMADSASNNTHRIIHLQYQASPLHFPNYAVNGNNDRWIAIQNYQAENWENLVQYWKFTHLHLVHVIINVNHGKLENKWVSESSYGEITLKDMITDFLRHFKLHLNEIEELMNKQVQ